MNSVLDQEIHRSLIADQARFASIAGISVNMLRESVKGHCSPKEIDWLKNIKKLLRDGKANLLLCDSQATSVDNKFMAMTGCLVRNFIDARFIPVLNCMEDDASAMKPTVLLVPDFYSGANGNGNVKEGKPFPAWQLAKLHNVLLYRMAHGKGTVLYARDRKRLKEMYGPGIVDLVGNNYTIYGD